MIQYVKSVENIRGNTNSTFLSLIPKELNPSSFAIFHPISLRNVSYKIISNIIDNYLKPFLPSLISPNQGGFVEKYKWWRISYSFKNIYIQVKSEGIKEWPSKLTWLMPLIE
jgi:hypothetical protein